MDLREVMPIGSRVCVAFFLSLMAAAANAADSNAIRRHRPPLVLNRGHAAKVDGVADGGVLVETLNGGHQTVRFSDVWRIRKAFASDEPPGSTVIDFAENRIFVATGLNELIALVGGHIPLVKVTSPNGDTVYMAANKVTDIFRALPGVHNPDSQSVIGTRDGIQQVREPLDVTQKLVAAAKAAH
jgi:hypothetical protein